MVTLAKRIQPQRSWTQPQTLTLKFHFEGFVEVCFKTIFLYNISTSFLYIFRFGSHLVEIIGWCLRDHVAVDRFLSEDKHNCEISVSEGFRRFKVRQWLDSELIPRLLENFENWKNFMVILLNVKNDAYRRIFGT